GLCGSTLNTVIISDSHGCDTILSYYVDEPIPIEITTSTAATTCGQVNGFAQADNVTGGTPPYSYNWSPGNYTTPLISNIASGNYMLQVTDANGCIAIENVFVSNIAPPFSNGYNISNVSCFGGSDGEVSVLVNGGTQPYSYSWSNFSLNDTATNIQAGTYYVTVTDANGCTSSSLAIVTQPSQLTIVANGTAAPICIGQFTNISATATGGTPPYIFYWSDSSLVQGSQVQQVSPEVTTAYQVYAVDANGCMSSPPAAVVVQVYPPLTLSVSPDTIICQGTDLVLYAYPGGGNGGPYTVQWSYGIGAQITVNPQVATTYTVTVFDGCGTPSVSGQVDVGVSQSPNVTSFTVGVGCAPLYVLFRPNNQDPAWNYSWNFDDMSSLNYNTSHDSVVAHTFNNSGIYSVSLIVTNINNCSTIVSQDVNVYEIPDAAFYAAPQVANILNANIEFFDQSTPCSQWEWNFGDNSHATGQNVEHEYDSAGVFDIQLVVHTINGCTDTTTGIIEIKEAHTFYAPTAFSPGSGLQNNYWYPKGIGIDSKEYHLYIYDRWGEIIFETEIYPLGTDKRDAGLIEGGWNGRYHNTGKYVPVGTYTWYITLKDVNGQMHEYVGAVTIIR
ncbi:MAG: PKD domain-containing protein, partial [Bacteroidota bacterium]